MARDVEGRDRVVFDLVDDDLAEQDGPATVPGPGPGAVDKVVDNLDGDGPDGDGPDGVGPDGGGPGGSAPGGVRVRSLRVPASVAAVVAVVLGTGFAVDGVRAAERIERAREMPGGVVDLSAPLEQTWAWEGQIGSEELTGEILVADLQGLLAFQSGDELLALDPASGEEAWSAPLGARPECGPVRYPGATGPTTSSLVCLQGDAARREVVVLGSDGVASAPRALDAADEDRYGPPRPGPEGTVLRAKRVGPGSAVDVGDARCTEETGECRGTVTAGRDLELRAEDAATGEERWTVTVPFRATAAQHCTPWYGQPWNGWADASADSGIAPDEFGATVGAGLVDLWGCGVEAAVTPGGVLLRDDGVAGPDLTASVDGGGYIQVTTPWTGDGTARTTVFAPEGTVVGEVPGYATSPRTIDEPEEMTLLASAGSGSRLRSYAADGSQRWDVPASPQSGSPEFLAQVDGTVVTSNWIGGVRGLEVATGEERWSWQPGEALDESFYEVGYVAQVFTDGRSVLLSLQSEEGAVELATVDVSSGDLGWNRSLADITGPQENISLLAVDGQLLAVARDGLRGLG